MSTFDSPGLIGVVTGILGIFGGGTLVALFKLPADKNRVVIETAQGAVILQGGVLDSLHAEIARLNLRMGEMEKEIHQLRTENDQLRRNTTMRLETLEQDG